MHTLRAATNADGTAVQQLVFGVLREFGLQADPASTDADLFDLEAHYAATGGAFDVIVSATGEIIGCVGLYPDEPGRCELRKMYLSSACRGLGLGKALLDHALKTAIKLGFNEVHLETAFVLKDAIALYERYGFVPYQATHCAPRCDVTYRLDLRKAPSLFTLP